ncbi:MAG: TadE/TadG family type IV pilus assembly protein [Bacillota bacterium]
MRCERGQALWEFAVVLPILVLILLGTLVLGLAVDAKLVVSSAAREGARYAAIVWESQGWGSLAGVRQKVRDALAAGGLNVSDPSYFNPAQDVQVADLGDYVQVTVSYRQRTFVRTLGQPSGLDLGSRLQLCSSSIFRKERSGP